MQLRVTTVTTEGELGTLAVEWNRLLTRAGSDLPFLRPEWLLTWWEIFRARSLLIRDSLYVKVVRDAAGELVGVVPFMRTDRPPYTPLRARALDLLGADPYITEQRAPVVDPAVAADVGRALAADLSADRGWDWIAWDGLERGSAFATALEQGLPLRWGGSQPANVLTLAPSWDEFRARLKRNIKESLRHGYNSLRREGHVPRLHVARAPAEVDAALGTFLRLHAMRANLDGTVEHPDRFASGRARRFLRLACARLAEQGVARVFTLHVGEQPVASRVAFARPGCLYFYYSGFDPAWARFGVMTTALAEAIKYAIAEGLPRAHLSMGADVSKSRWGPSTPLFHDAFTVRDRLSSRLALRLFEAAREIPVTNGLLRRFRPHDDA